MTSPVERVGVFGGTFNPIHLGHLRAAEQMLAKLGLARVVFVPAADPPQKRGGRRGSRRRRCGSGGCRPRCMDTRRSRGTISSSHRAGPSYSVDTLRALRVKLAPARLVFIVGERRLRRARRLARAGGAAHPRPLRGDDAPSRPREAAAQPDLRGARRAHRMGCGRRERAAPHCEDERRSRSHRRARRLGHRHPPSHPNPRSVRYLLPEAVHDAVIESGAYETT